MKEIPFEANKELERLKKEYKAYLYVRIIDGKFYVYKGSSIWDKETKKVRGLTEYLGRIDENGKFIKKISNKKKIPIQTLVQGTAPQAIQTLVDQSEIKLLRILSMNAKADLSFLGKKFLGINSSATFYKVRQLKERYGIKGIAEIDVTKLGYTDYIAFVKFEGDKPSADNIRKATLDESQVQLVLATNGEYDLIIYFLAKDNFDASEFIFNLRYKEHLKTCISQWYFSPIDICYNFIPLRDQFFELMKEKVWVKSRESQRRLEGQLTIKEYNILRELNRNGVAKFSEMDKKHGLGGEETAYIYEKLIERGILKRMTVSLQKIPLQYNAVIIMGVVDNNGFRRTRDRLLMDVIEENGTPINKYSVMGNIGNPDGVMFIMPITPNNRLDVFESEFKERIKGVALRTLIVTDVLVGSLCYRKFDNAKSRQYRALRMEGNTELSLADVDYDETVRRKQVIKKGEDTIEELLANNENI